MNLSPAIACAAVGFVAAVANASTVVSGFDLDAVTALSRGAVVGQNVEAAVPGFEVRLLKDGVPVYGRAFGAFEVGRVVNVDSSTKTLSGAMMMSLSESAVRPFSLDAPLSTYLPSFTGAKAAITVRQAFSHTSGLDDSEVIGSTTLTLQQAAARIGQFTPLAYGPPGTQFKYGGTSMHAAGAAAEIAGGKPWRELFAERITGPLEMADTRFVLGGDANPRIAGGVESNAADFGRFMDMLLNEGVDRATGRRVLSAASVRAMLSRQVADDVTLVGSPLTAPTDYLRTDYGVGVWFDGRGADGEVNLALAAGARGFTSWVDLDDGYVGVFSTDLTRGDNIRELARMIADAAENALRNPRTPGDATRDGAVDFADLVTLAQHYGQTSRLWADGDFSGDGVVGFDDLVGLAQKYGTPATFAADWARAAAIVPEPGVFAAVSVAGWCGGRRRRRVLGGRHSCDAPVPSVPEAAGDCRPPRKGNRTQTNKRKIIARAN